jgi:ABC-type branched-subunit amino acid transport system substrate-binding protein
MKKLGTLVLCLFCTLLFVGCTQKPVKQSPTPSSVENNEPQVVKIGVIAPLSGPAASIGKDAVSTFTFATKQFNSSQKKYTIELIIEDGKCNGKDASSAAQKLVNIDNVKIILG